MKNFVTALVFLESETDAILLSKKPLQNDSCFCQKGCKILQGQVRSMQQKEGPNGRVPSATKVRILDRGEDEAEVGRSIAPDYCASRSRRHLRGARAEQNARHSGNVHSTQRLVQQVTPKR